MKTGDWIYERVPSRPIFPGALSDGESRFNISNDAAVSFFLFFYEFDIGETDDDGHSQSVSPFSFGL